MVIALLPTPDFLLRSLLRPLLFLFRPLLFFRSFPDFARVFAAFCLAAPPFTGIYRCAWGAPAAC